MAVRLFVGNLPYSTTEAEIREHFSPVAPLSYIYLPTDRETGKPRGFAFVEIDDAAKAQEAIRRFNNQPFKGRPLVLNEARAKDSRPQSSAPPRPSPSRAAWAPEPDIFEAPRREGKPGRNFGPDASPRRNRKSASRGQKGERAPKGPLRERSGGQIFGDDDDSFYDDDLGGENFASRVRDSEDEDNA